MELSNSSYQRQLAAERKKTVSAQEEIRALQEELERLTNKLKVHVYKLSPLYDCAQLAAWHMCENVILFTFFSLSGEGERTRCQEHLCQPHGESFTKKRYRELHKAER